MTCRRKGSSTNRGTLHRLAKTRLVLEATRLLGKYVYTNVRLNVGLQATDFDRKTYGL